MRALKSRLGITALIFLMTIVSFFNVPSSMRPSCSPTMREVLCSLDAPVVVLDVVFDIALPGCTHEKGNNEFYKIEFTHTHTSTYTLKRRTNKIKY